MQIFLPLMLFICTFGFGEEPFLINNNQKIEALLQEETTHIFEQSSSNPSYDLADAYLARSESYLLLRNGQDALSDLQHAYTIGSLLPNEEDKISVLFRSLFGMIIAYSTLDMEDMAIQAHDEFRALISNLQYRDCSNHPSTTSSTHLQKISKLICYIPTEWKPEDREDCESKVRKVANLMKVLAAINTNRAIVASLEVSICLLEEECLKCCKTAGFWQRCIDPIWQKWKRWNDKYEMFRIPHDPYWD